MNYKCPPTVNKYATSNGKPQLRNWYFVKSD